MSRRIAAAELLGDPALRPCIAKREQQRDGDRVGVELGQGREVERGELAVGARTPAHADASLERDERRGVLHTRPVQVRPRLPAQVQHVLEALVRDERGSRSTPLQERVRRDRRPVGEAADVRGTESSCGRDDGQLLARGGRNLGDAHDSVLDEHCVRERPADVDPERAHRTILDD